jgi:hypothetical protein
MRRKLLPALPNFQSIKAKQASPSTDFIYVLGTDVGLVKIGTTNNLWARFKQLRGMSPQKLEPLMFWNCRSGKGVEAALHVLFRDYRKHGEWFEFGHYDAPWSWWKYRHLALSALLTATRLPIPIHRSVLYYIQTEHVPDDDPIHDAPGGGDWSGRECYPPELFASFYPDEDDAFRLRDWPIDIQRLYGFGGSQGTSTAG